MPTGPKGEKRPADVIGAAVMVARIATGETPDKRALKQASKVRSGKAGAAARDKALTDSEKRRIAKKAASARWNND